MKYYRFKQNTVEHYLIVSEQFDVISHNKLELVLLGVYNGMNLNIEYEKDVKEPEYVLCVSNPNRKHLKELSLDKLKDALSKLPDFDLNTLKEELASVPKAKRTALQKLNITFLDTIR